MQYVVETSKSVEQASADLEAAVKQHNFGVLHVHNLREEICNPQQALDVLTEDMSMNMALPCRISVYEEGGKTKIGMIKPTTLLASLSQSKVLMGIAEEVEQKTIQMIEEAK
jgi:uncharacterized protein (DUF302 family)